MTTSQSPVFIENVEDIEKEDIGDGKHFKAKLGRFTSLFGMKAIGCGVVELEPGQKAWPYHLHYGQEELFVILKGEGVLRYDDEFYAVKAGDVIFTPPGDGTAHQISNESDQVIQYLALSSKESPEVCYYPDSDKVGSYMQNPDGTRKAFIAQQDSAVSFFAGEDDQE